jgi:hypothetical protein
MVELPGEERFGKLAKPELEDGGSVVDVGEVFFGEEIGSFDICEEEERGSILA